MTLIGNRFFLLYINTYIYICVYIERQPVTYLAFEETRKLHKNYSIFFLHIAVNAAVILCTSLRDTLGLYTYKTSWLIFKGEVTIPILEYNTYTFFFF